MGCSASNSQWCDQCLKPLWPPIELNELRDGEEARRGLELPSLPPPNLRGVIAPSGLWFFTRIGSAFLAGRFEILPAPLPLLPVLVPRLLVPRFDPLPGKVAIFEGLCTGR